jgi:sec-independent protein translocase protein TatC
MEENQESKATVWEHVADLRHYAIISVVTVIACSVIAHFFYQDIVRLIFAPLGTQKALFLSPLDPITFVLKIDLSVGTIASLPIILWCLIRFMAPALSRHAVRIFLLVLVSCGLLVIVAVLYSYYLVIPLMIRFLAGIDVPGTTYQITAQAYLSFVIMQVLIAVAVFQTPLVLVALTYAGLLNPKRIAQKRPLLYIGATIVCSVVTPTTDLFSLSLVLIPTLAALEVGIGISRLVYTKRHSSVNAHRT